MSGHSKWSTIKRQKGLTDVKRSKTFTKLANAITIAARLGGSGDPESNPRLRTVFDEARGVNMPKDIITRAIDRGLRKLPGQTLEEVAYEGFGPGKVAFYIEGVTDNKLRTSQEVKNIFERSGGHLGGQGSTSYMFDQIGEIRLKGKGGKLEDELLELIDTGAEDVEDFEDEGLRVQKFLIYIDPLKLNTVSNNITQLGYEIEGSAMVMKPNLTTEIYDSETAQKVLALAERLEELDDVQKVFANFKVS